MAVFRRNRSDIRSTSIRSTTGVQGELSFFAIHPDYAGRGLEGNCSVILYIYGKRIYSIFMCFTEHAVTMDFTKT